MITDSHYIYPVITNPVTGNSDTNSGCESAYRKNLTVLNNNVFPFLSLGFDLNYLKNEYKVANFNAKYIASSFNNIQSTNESILFTWENTRVFNFYILKLYKNSVLVSNKILAHTETQFTFTDSFNINDRIDIIIIPVLNDNVENLNNSNTISLFIIREEVSNQKYVVYSKSASNYTSLDFKYELSSNSDFAIKDVAFEIDGSSLKVSFSNLYLSSVKKYSIIYNEPQRNKNDQRRVDLLTNQNIVFIDNFNFNNNYTFCIIPIHDSMDDIYLINNIYDVSFTSKGISTCSDSKVDLSKYDNLIPESFRNDDNLIKEVLELLKQIVNNFEDDSFAKYRLENLRTEFKYNNSLYENFIWSIADLILAKTTFALKGTEEGFLFALNQSDIYPVGLNYNNIYNGSEILVRIDNNTPDFSKYNYADKLANIFLPIYTTFTGVTNCDEITDISPARLGYNAKLGSHTRLGYYYGNTVKEISKTIHFLICRKDEYISFADLDMRIDGILARSHIANANLTRVNKFLDYTIYLDYQKYNYIEELAWQMNTGILTQSTTEFNFDAVQNYYHFTLNSLSTCTNQVVLGKTILGDDLSPLSGRSNIVRWENGLDSLVFGYTNLGGEAEKPHKITTYSGCQLHREITYFRLDASDAIEFALLNNSIAETVYNNHYFEAYQIDKLDYNLTIGESLAYKSLNLSVTTTENLSNNIEYDTYFELLKQQQCQHQFILDNVKLGDFNKNLGGNPRLHVIENALGYLKLGDYKLSGGTIRTIKHNAIGGLNLGEFRLGGYSKYPFETTIVSVVDDKFKHENYYVGRCEIGINTELSYGDLYSEDQHGEISNISLNSDIGSALRVSDFILSQSLILDQSGILEYNTNRMLQHTIDYANNIEYDTYFELLKQQQCVNQFLLGYKLLGDDLSPLDGFRKYNVIKNALGYLKLGDYKLSGGTIRTIKHNAIGDLTFGEFRLGGYSKYPFETTIVSIVDDQFKYENYYVNRCAINKQNSVFSIEEFDYEIWKNTTTTILEGVVKYKRDSNTLSGDLILGQPYKSTILPTLNRATLIPSYGVMYDNSIDIGYLNFITYNYDIVNVSINNMKIEHIMSSISYATAICELSNFEINFTSHQLYNVTWFNTLGYGLYNGDQHNIEYNTNYTINYFLTTDRSEY